MNPTNRTYRPFATYTNDHHAAVIVGGELSVAGSALTDGIREAIARYAQPSVARAVTVTTGTLESRAELLGAIALAIQRSDSSRHTS